MRLDDLTIFLKAVDQTKRATQSASKNVLSVGNAVKAVAKLFKGLGTIAIASLTGAAANGRQLTTELNSVSRQLDITFQEAQALFLAVQNADSSTNLDNLNEALLSIKERFADAATGAGPLIGLIEDFEGFDLDLGIDNARDQLADFLEQVAQLPNANARIFALKEVIGDEDARPFFNIINNTEKLNTLLVDLRTNVEDVEGVLSDFRVQGIQDANTSTKELNDAWDQFSINTFATFAPALAQITSAMARLVELGSDFITQYNEATLTFANFVRTRILGRSEINGGIELTERSLARIADLERQAAEEERAAREKAAADEIARQKRIQESRRNAIEELKRLNQLARDAGREDLVSSTVSPITPEQEEILQLLANPPEIAPDSNTSDFGGTIIPDGTGNTSGDFLFTGSNINPNILDDGNTKALDSIANAGNAANDSIVTLEGSLGTLSNAFGEFANAAGRNNERAFRSFQQLQIALSTAAAITTAIKTASELPPGAGFARVAAYASVLGTLLAGVAQIRSLSASGSSSVTSPSTSTPNVPATNVGNNAIPVQNQNDGGNREININITGVLGDQQLTTLAEQIANEINDNDNIRLAS